MYDNKSKIIKVKSGGSTAKDIAVDTFQTILRDTLSVGVGVSRSLKSLDENITGGFFNFPDKFDYGEEGTTSNKILTTLLGKREGRETYVGGFKEEGSEISNILESAYGNLGLSKEMSEKIGTETQALFALTSFIPGKKTLLQTLTKETSANAIQKELVKAGFREDIAKSYSTIIAPLKDSKKINEALDSAKRLETTTKSIDEVIKNKDIIKLPNRTKFGNIKYPTGKNSSKIVKQIENLKRQEQSIKNNIVRTEKEKILKSNFKSELQQQQELFSNKLINVVRKFKEIEAILKDKNSLLKIEKTEIEKGIKSQKKVIDDMFKDQVNILKTSAKKEKDLLQGVKNDLFKIAKEYIPDKKISKSLTKKLVEAGNSESKIRKVILDIGKEKDKLIKSELISSIKDIISKSDNFSVRSKEKIASTLSGIRLRGMTKETIDKIEKMKDHFSSNPEKERLLGKKNTQLLKRVDDIKKKDLSSFNNAELRELERRLSYIDKINSLETKTRQSTKKLQTEIIIDGITKNINNLDIPGRIESIGKDLTIKEKGLNLQYQIKNFIKKGELNYVSIDNFFDMLGEEAYKFFKAGMDKIDGYAKERYAKHANNFIKFESELFKEYGEKLKKSNYERIFLWATMQQKGGLNKLLKTGIKTLNKEYLNSIKLTAHEMEMYNYMRSILDEIHPEVNDVLMKTSDGKKKLGYIENYFPLVTDFTESKELAEMLFDEYNYNRRGLNKGFTKNRNIIGVEGQVFNADSRSIFLNYIRKTSDFIEKEEAIKQMQSVASSSKFKTSAGDLAQSMINSWLDTISRGGIPKNYVRSFIDDLRDNVGSAYLGFRISPIVKQPIAKITAGSLLGPKHTFIHDIEFIQNNMTKYVDEASKQQRFRAFDDPSFNVSTLNKWQQWGYEGIKAVDKLTANSTWYSAYKKFFDDNNLKFSIDDFKAGKYNDDAIDFADKITRKTNGSGDIKDLPMMLTGKNKRIWKTIFQFQSFVLNQSQLLTVDIKNAILKEKNPTKAFNILTFFVLAGMAESYISSGITYMFGSEKAKEAQADMSFPERIADSFFGQIPLVNNFLGVSKYGGSGIPLIDTTTNLIDDTSSIFTSKKKQTKAKSVTGALTDILSISGVAGSGQLNQFLDRAIESMIEEKSSPINYGPIVKSKKK